MRMTATVNEVMNDPWAVFVEPTDRNPSDASTNDNNVSPTLEQLWSSRRRVSDSKWRWLCDVCDVLDAGYDSEIGEALDSLVANFRFTASEYSICLRPSADFPESAPETNSTLGNAFELTWNEGSTLLSTCSEYAEVCSLFDAAIVECSEVDYPFKFVAWKLNPDEADCVTIELSFLDEKSEREGRLTLVVEWRSPRSFPRSIHSSEPNRLHSVPFDRWDTTLSFGESLGRLFVQQEDVNVESL